MDKITWNKRALKQIRKMPAKVQKAIGAAVEDLPITDG